MHCENDGSAKLALESRTSALENSASRTVGVHAVLGFVDLYRGTYLGVVTRSKAVVVQGPRGAEMRQVLGAEFFPIPYAANNTRKFGVANQGHLKNDGLFLDMLYSVIETQCLYYSHNYDITQTAQRIAFMGDDLCPSLPEHSDGLWRNVSKAQAATGKLPAFTSQNSRADPRFFWNKNMVVPFEKVGLEEWIHPMMCGYIEVAYNVRLRDSDDPDSASFTYLFISRRSRERQGTRFNMRGLDEEGHAANFVETEQIIMPDADKNSSRADVAVCSYVQTRGSIPTIWNQYVTLKYAPRVDLLGSKQERFECFQAHFGGVGPSSVPDGEVRVERAEHALNNYGSTTCINLVDREGSSNTVLDQRKLGKMFELHVAERKDSKLRLVWFDFHHECRGMKYHNLAKLMKQVDDDLKRFGFFVQLRNGEVEQWQLGVMRTNCMDCLDRTNVIQTMFARFVTIEMVDFLQKKNAEKNDDEETQKILKQKTDDLHKDPLNSPYGRFERSFKAVWRKNADTMSVLYAGTPAMKTRLGTLGLAQDGLNSLTRYYINNFQDGTKQDAIDLFLGKFQVTKSSIGIFASDPSDESLVSCISKLVFVFLGVFTLCTLLAWYGPTFNFKVAFWTTLVFALIIVHRALKGGLSPKFCSKPKLCKRIKSIYSQK